MKFLSITTLLLAILLQYSCDNIGNKTVDQSLVLWYDKPANEWTEALPLGNGRIGSMVYGGTENEIIQFNEETLWTGQPHDYSHEDAHEVLNEMRQLLWNGKQDEAHKLGNERFMSQPFGQFCYQPFGNILLHFPGHDSAVNYSRSLDLEDAISYVHYEVDGVKYTRETFVSQPDQALIVHLESSKKGKLNFTVGLNTPHKKYDISIDGDEKILKGKANNYPQELDWEKNPYPESKLTFEARLKVVNEGGELLLSEDEIEVKNADKVNLSLVAASSFVNYQDISGNPKELCNKYLAEIEDKSYEELKEKHINDYQELFSRVKLDL
ncbi:MAG: glycoside hydrolase family 95 protein, partial [Bacteroidales bacterium]|nr:glycoside hydrolase family 95 protein [Bacteroidales bacterium]